jgi:polyphosphate glucokinase
MSQPTNNESRIHFGVDVGGTGIKAAPVDLTSGSLTTERLRIPTPQPSTPDAVSRVVGEVVRHFGWTGPVGVAFPSAVKAGVAMTAANIDKRWIGTNIEDTFEAATGTKVRAVNDADAAGVAELAYGAGRGQHGLVMMTTFGTGIGTALFLHGQLVPNTELGHLEIGGKVAETEASELVRERKQLSWAKWAKRVDRYLRHLENLFWPDLIIIGGGASRKADKFLPLLTVRTPVVPAALQNDAGIVGAAVVADVDVTRPGGRRRRSEASGSSVPPAAAPAPAAEQAMPPAAVAPAKAPAKRSTTKRTAAGRSPAKEAASTRTPGSSASPPVPPAG